MVLHMRLVLDLNNTHLILDDQLHQQEILIVHDTGNNCVYEFINLRTCFSFERTTNLTPDNK